MNQGNKSVKVGIGYCNNSNAFHSGRSAASEAMSRGDVDRPDLVIAFCSGGLDHEAFLKGIKDIVGGTPVIGGSSIGVITNENLSYKGFPAGVAIIQSDEIKYQVVSSGGIDTDTNLAGYSLASQLSESFEDKLLLMFYDSIMTSPSSNGPPVMNASSELIEGIESVLQANQLIIGGGLIGDYQFNKTKQFCGSQVCEQSAVGALISGSVSVYHTITHGCSPLDGIYRKITKMQGAAIYELDGLPVVEIIDEIYMDQDWQTQHPLNFLTIGVNHGERFFYKEKEYVNRLITGIAPDGSGIQMFEPDLEQGMEVQFMLRDGNKMITSARNQSELVVEEIINDGKKPFFALYIDCAGRAAGISNTETEEAIEIQQVMNRYAVPLLGFYSGVEIAPILGKSRGLDWTGVLLVLARDN